LHADIPKVVRRKKFDATAAHFVTAVGVWVMQQHADLCCHCLTQLEAVKFKLAAAAATTNACNGDQLKLLHSSSHS
jgi:hypothetical protein